MIRQIVDTINTIAMPLIHISAETVFEFALDRYFHLVDHLPVYC